MPCWKCKTHHWPDPQDVIYTDEADKKDYCLFHAPAEHKGMSAEDFNAEVFARINDFKANNKTPSKLVLCNLSGTIFPGDITFEAYDKDNPLPGIVFSEALFSGEANFFWATFGGAAYFVEATFSGVADFTGATFGGKTDFWAATFDGQTDFKQATFGNKVDFGGVQAKENALHMHSLDSATLANLSFTSMETECFSFKGCDWPDGGLWPETEKEPDYKACEELYRSLKQKAASEHDQPMVSKWHYREKLMGLKGLISDEQALKLLDEIEGKEATPWRKARSAAHLLRLAPGLLLSLNFWYWAISGYGEREIRAGAWLAFLAVLPFVLNAFPHPIEEFPFSEQVNNTLAHFPFTKDIQGQGGWLRLGKGLSQLLIALQAALFAFALRNRFRR